MTEAKNDDRRPAGRFEVRVTSDSHFSWLRTRLSLERTLMAWLRTAVSLIGFGFTIVQFFDRVQNLPGVLPARFPDAPRYLGLALIACGVAALVISIGEYRWSLDYLWSADFRPIAGVARRGKLTPIYAASIALIVVGLLTFMTLLFRII
jgi:putative membrane protein